MRETKETDMALLLGSEAVEGALKLAREYFVWTEQPERVNFVSRDESYHGTTVGSLSLSGHVVRRAPFEPLLLQQRHNISSCNPYRQRLPDESDAAFVARKMDELNKKFLELGPHTVAAVILEPVVGAALGCAPPVAGYLKAVEQLCHKHGALLILDEVMCGMGRTGTLHAWEQEGECPTSRPSERASAAATSLRRLCWLARRSPQ
jgi:adenosylmethionine-8-amino-7-oxononanoate aminotransferase